MPELIMQYLNAITSNTFLSLPQEDKNHLSSADYESAKPQIKVSCLVSITKFEVLLSSLLVNPM